jgi:hypothetical protein
MDGLAALATFIREGGTLIVEGSTAALLTENGLTQNVLVEQPVQLVVRGSILRGRVADRTSPITYGYVDDDLPVYFNQAPVLNVSDAGPIDGAARPRAVVRFAADAGDLLLSGTLGNGQLLAGRAAVVDTPVGKGHVVMFAIRPFWRWQTHGTFTLGFNAIMNWNDLDASAMDVRR